MLKKHQLFQLTLIAAMLIAALVIIGINITPLRRTTILPTLAILPSETRVDHSESSPEVPESEIAALSSSVPSETASIEAVTTTKQAAQITVEVQSETTTPVHRSTATIPPQLLSNPTLLPVQSTLSATPSNTPIVSLTPPPMMSLPPPVEQVPNTQIITLSENMTDAQLSSFVLELEAAGGEVVQTIDSINAVIVTLPEEVLLETSSVIIESEPDYYVSALTTVPPNDPLFPDQWALTAIEGLEDAWAAMPSNAAPVVVAVIDSGICASHADLQGRILTGYDFVEKDTTPQDDFGHGCAVSGIIAANANDNLGIAGVAPNAHILPLRVLNAQGLGQYSDVAAAIVYAADHGAQVINLSLGGTSRSAILESAVDYAISKGLLVIAAAGNTGGSVMFPASYSPVIAVGSVDPNLQRSRFSNTGAEIDVLAPGRDIVTTSRNGSWGIMTGTSFAAPHVAAIAAMQISRGLPLVTNGSLLRMNNPLVTPTGTTDATTPLTLTPNSYLPITAPMDIPLVPGNDSLEPAAEYALRQIISQSYGRELAASNYYSISALHQEEDWYFVSVVGLTQLDEAIGWRLEDANWVGLILLYETSNGTWLGAVEGTISFSEILAQIPATVLSLEAKQGIDPLQADAQAEETYRFPWQTNTSMVYGSLGVHDNGFSGVVTGWKAVDFLSNGDISAGYAPNSLLTAAGGSIGYVCNDGTSVAIKIGNLFYSHLVNNTNLQTGRTFNQGEQLGQLRTGTFNYRCGYASQSAGWFHVHWGFPNTGTFSVEDWTLNLTESIWRRASESRSTGSTLRAGSNNGPCPAPSLINPADNIILTSAAVTFNWSAVSRCTFSGYTFRINDSADMNDTPIVSIDVTGTSRIETINPQWHNKALWWSVRAANAPTGAAWAVRQFRINIPDTTPPTGSLLSPTNSSSQRGPSIWLQANATDTGSGVKRVEFYAWSTESWSNQQWMLLNSDTSAPYEYSWNVNNIPNGGIWLSVNIVDNAGNQSGIVWGVFVNLDKSITAVSGIGIYNPPDGRWYLSDNINNGVPNWMPQFGGFGTPVVGDWNGNSTDTIGIYYSGSWYLRNRNENGGADYPVFQFGGFGTPVVGDWNGDGRDTVGVYNPADGRWYLTNLDGTAPSILQFGGFGLPVTGDWNGDGRDTIGVYNPADGYWYLSNLNGTSPSIFQFGGFGSPVIGDWNGDGRDTVGIYNPADGRWYLSNLDGTPPITFTYGGFGVPVVGTWSIAGAFSVEGAMIPFSGDWSAITAQMIATEEPTSTPTPTDTSSPVLTNTPTIIFTPTETITTSPSLTLTATETEEPTLTSISVPTVTETEIPTGTPVPAEVPTASDTPIPLTATPVWTATATPAEPTAVATSFPSATSTLADLPSEEPVPVLPEVTEIQ